MLWSRIPWRWRLRGWLQAKFCPETERQKVERLARQRIEWWAAYNSCKEGWKDLPDSQDLMQKRADMEAVMTEVLGPDPSKGENNGTSDDST